MLKEPVGQRHVFDLHSNKSKKLICICQEGDGFLHCKFQGNGVFGGE